MDWLGNLLASKGEVFAAGVIGSAVAGVFEWNGWLPFLRKVFVGSMSAVYLWPIAVPFLKWGFISLQIENADQGASAMSAFLMGLLGMIIVEYIFALVRLRLKREVKKEESSK